jgi:hypothetical protein
MCERRTGVLTRGTQHTYPPASAQPRSAVLRLLEAVLISNKCTLQASGVETGNGCWPVGRRCRRCRRRRCTHGGLLSWGSG